MTNNRKSMNGDNAHAQKLRQERSRRFICEGRVSGMLP